MVAIDIYISKHGFVTRKTRKDKFYSILEDVLKMAQVVILSCIKTFS